MTGHTKGKAFLLKISDGKTPPNYTTVAGLRTIAESVSGGVSITASGIFLGSDAENQVRHYALSGTFADCELSYEDGEKLHRRFLVQRLDFAGDYHGERNYTIQLESADTRAGSATIPDPQAFMEAARGMREALGACDALLARTGYATDSIAREDILAALAAFDAAQGEQ